MTNQGLFQETNLPLQGSNMFHLLYVSSAVKHFSKNELVEMLNKARENNLRLGVTGLLVYKDGNFMQVLEGDKPVVLDLYATISADPRHHDGIIILEEEIEKPVFADWSMGFRDLSDPKILALPSFSRFMNNTLSYESVKDDPTGALELLNFFRLH